MDIAAQRELVTFCKNHSILFNSYSPLGIPDWHNYPSAISTTGRILEEPKVQAIAKNHGLTPAQALLAWQWQQGIVFNPRSMRESHMRENMDSKVYSTKLDDSEMQTLSSFKQDACSLSSGGGGGASASNHWYECCGDPAVQASIPSCS